MHVGLLWLYMCDISSKGGDLDTVQRCIKQSFIERDSALLLKYLMMNEKVYVDR